MILPVARRELSTAARNPKFYRWRVLAGVAEILGAGLLFVASSNSIGRAGAGQFFRFLAGITLLFCLLDGLRKAADSISEERREGTLGLLFLGGLGSGEIVLGKFVSALTRSASGLLAFFPILAISLLLGGITGGELFRVMLALGASLLASTSLCLLISAASREDSVLKALGAVAALCALPPLIARVFRSFTTGGWIDAVTLVSPLTLFHATSEAGFVYSSRGFWIGLTELLAFSVLALVATRFVLTHNWHDQPQTAATRRWSIPLLRPKVQRRRELLDENPFLWLCFNSRGHSSFITVLLLIAALGGLLLLVGADRNERMPIVLFLTFAAFLLAQIRIALQASQTLIAARTSGLIELAMGTLMSPRHILDGQWAALQKTIWPMIVWAGGAVAAVLTLGVGPTLWSAFYVAQAVLGLFTAGWTGIWMSLTCKTGGQALFRTLVTSVIVPNVPCFCGLSIPLQFGLIYFARKRIRAVLRGLTAQNDYFYHLPGRGLIQESAPPVIRQ